MGIQVLTPSGYVNPVTLADGASVCAFDENNTGKAIINTVERIDFVDYQEWCRWWSIEDEVPSFDWYRINGHYLLFREQSVWRNGINVCHARDLVVGDIIYDDHDNDVFITSIERVTDESLIWYRFDISGDHSYIIDGLTVHNASRFWVLGTGTWDSSTTTHWASASNGAGGQTVPGSADAVTFDGSSGGGTVTLNFGGTITVQSITTGAFTGTWDNSVNNNNITMNLASSTVWNGSGSATRTIKMGSATYTLTGIGATFAFATITGLTLTASSSTITFTGASSNRQMSLATGLTMGTLNLGASTLGTGGNLYSLSGSCTYAAINITAPNRVSFQFSSTTTITAATNWAGSSNSQISLHSSSGGSQAHLALASGSKASWCGIADIDVSSGSLLASNSFDLGDNSQTNTTITPPIMAAQPIIIARGAPY